jgi:hypothetical protein
MGTPIISPWFFYIIGLIEPLTFITILGLVVALCVGALTWYDAVESPITKEEYDSRYKSVGKKCVILSVIFGLLLIFVPSQQVCIQMLIANNITYERLETAGSSIENIYNDIIAIAEKAVGTVE